MRTFLGWYSLIVLILAVGVNIGNSKDSGGERVLQVILNGGVLVYVIWTLLFS